MVFMIYRLIISLFLLAWIGFVEASAVHEYQLTNGLKLIVKEDHRAPVVFSSVWYKVGGSFTSMMTLQVFHMFWNI